MKTILEWYEELPEPIRSQAIANYDGNVELAENRRSAIQSGFIWYDTPEGQDHWQVVSDKAKEGYYDQPPSPLEQSLSDLTKTLEEMKEAIESVRKAIGNENN
jgi:hypothetical protein